MTNGTPKKGTWVSKRPGAHTNKKALSAINARIDRAMDRIRSLQLRCASLEERLLISEDGVEDE